MNHGSSPGARPLVVDVCCNLRYPQARQPVLVGPPLMALCGVGGDPAKGLCGLGIGYFGRKHGHEGVVSHDVSGG